MVSFSKTSISYPAVPVTAAIVGGFPVHRRDPALETGCSSAIW